MRDLIILGILLVIVFNGCDIRIRINGEIHTLEVEALVITEENRKKEDEKVH